MVTIVTFSLLQAKSSFIIRTTPIYFSQSYGYKKSFDLKTLSVFQQLFELIFYPYNSLCFCLNQPRQAK
jgi:hypothetical protein